MGEVFGIDVSHYQLDIDWQKVRADGKKFAILKCQYEAQSHRKDEYFEANYSGCAKNDIMRGVYIFIGSKSIADPVHDALCLLKHLNGRKLEYGIWLDLEADALRKVGKAKITWLVHVYANIFQAAGYYVGIYCNKDWYYNVLDGKGLSRDYDFWIARYPSADKGNYNFSSSLKPRGYAVAWQYSSKGRVPGIKGNVDMDVDFDGTILLNTPMIKTDKQIAQEVLDNRWGTANTFPTRKELLEAAGYNYENIRSIVNSMC
ncbi:MAG: hypothetical protein IJH64_10115 [Oscillospiraceae bacterium]|nr:hypothetical protein [Oscillospiraceae bacterium]